MGMRDAGARADKARAAPLRRLSPNWERKLPWLHHHATTRIAACMLPKLFTLVAFAAMEALAALFPLRDVPAVPAQRRLLLVLLLTCSCGLAMLAALYALLRGGPRSTLRAAQCSAVLHVVPTALVAKSALDFAPQHFCPAAPSAAACADVMLRSYLGPLGAPKFALAGLPPRVALPLELLRLTGLFLVTCASAAARHEALPLPWAAAFLARSAVWAAATSVLLRVALGGDEPRELHTLHACPRWLCRTRNALLEAGARAERVPLLASLARVAVAALLLRFLHFCAWALLHERGGLTAAVAARNATVGLWLCGTLAATAHVASLHARRAARHARQPANRRVHALHLRLSALDAGLDTESSLAMVARELLLALPAGCSVGLAEWTTSGDPMPDVEAHGSRRSSLDASPSPRRLFLQHVLARSPRPAAERAMCAAVRRGCTRGGSAAEAVAKPTAVAGLTLDSEDYTEGAAAYADWAALVADSAAGPGTVCLALVGFGGSVHGGLWVHAPASVPAPVPATVRDCANCIGAVLLRNRAHRAALRAAAAEARADADATLALQRSFVSGITHGS